MKIRLGFVSNSSSSSWSICMWGIEMDAKKYILHRTLACGDIVSEGVRDGGNINDIVYELSDTKDVEVDCYQGEVVYIGRSLTSCRDDETMGCFKKETQEKVNKFMGAGDWKCHLINESFEEQY